jgi:hypothetical protein
MSKRLKWSYIKMVLYNKIKHFTNSSKKFVINLKLLLIKFFPVLRLLLFNSNNKNVIFFRTINEIKSRHSTISDFNPKVVEGVFAHPNYSVNLKDIHFQNISFITYTATFYNVWLVGSSNFVFFDTLNALYDLKENDFENRFEYIDDALLTSNGNIGVIKVKRSSKKIDEAINLINNFSWNYYHLMFEVMVKFQEINTSIQNKKIPILVDRVVKRIPQYFELLNYFNIHNHPIVFVEKFESIEVAVLHHFSPPNIIPPNIKSIFQYRASDTIFQVSSLEYVKKVTHTHKSHNDSAKRIYISRKNASNRRTFNESEIISCLKDFNFEVVYPELMSISEQMGLFYNAEFIIGGSGAAFTNIISASPNCKVIILMKDPLDISIFSTIAVVNNLRLVYLSENDSKNKVNNNLHGSYHIEIQKFRNLLIEMLS